MRGLWLLLVLWIGLSTVVKADEGMWLPSLVAKLNIGEMQEMGFKLSAEDVYNINNSSLKDAVVLFGEGCTGEMISEKGLLLTNHHCGRSIIQQHSTVDNDLLANGFWAGSFDEERVSPGLSVTFLIRVEEMTGRINESLSPGMDEAERNIKIRELTVKIQKEAEEGTHYKAVVEPLFGGNKFYLFVYEVFNDVRLVGAPPVSIGKFGGETDNWMWPRHTADFSLFRIYASPDGKPAYYSPENVPLKPRHHLPISLKGIQEGNFAMIMGYPGNTDRYLTSWGIEEKKSVINKSRLSIRGTKQDIWLGGMKADSKIKFRYSSKYAESSNYWKNSLGMNRAIDQLGVIGQKRELEKEFNEWVNEYEARKKKYGDVLTALEEGYAGIEPYSIAQNYLYETLLNGTEIVRFALNVRLLERALAMKGKNKEAIEQEKIKLRWKSKDFFKHYDASLDKKVLSAMLKEYQKHVPAMFLLPTYTVIDKKFNGDYDRYAEYLFKKSIFTNEKRFEGSLEKITLKTIRKDPAYLMGRDVLFMLVIIHSKAGAYADKIDWGNRLFISGLKEMQPNRVFYPDANLTMRLTYGRVGGYEPSDGITYNHFTTMKGIVGKSKLKDPEFQVPQKLIELYEKKDYGNYADKDGTMHVCFLTNTDTSGGSSGSPVINAEGELFGVTFDGNWEAMSGDIAFEKKLQRSINVDIRYVLFIIDKFAGATRLIEEMTIIR